MSSNLAAAPAYVEPVFKTIRVNAPPERAFEVFTAGMTRWWVKSHSINPTKSPQLQVVMEPRVGGRWYERGEDGSECDWGHVLLWEPPHRVVLAWQINARWTFDPTLVTQLDVQFEAQADGTTQVSLEHRDLERFGADAARVRESIGSEMGWGGLLAAFAQSVR
jgi:uncharacterized protein YndB with AHSA1/START domain